MSLFVESFIGMLEFIGGFVIGTIIDLIFFQFYLRINDINNYKLLALMFIQLYVLVVVIQVIGRISNDGYFIKIGFISSQLFLLKFSIKKLSNIICNRKQKIKEVTYEKDRNV